MKASLYIDINLPVSIDDDILNLKICLTYRRYISILSVYEQTIQVNEDTILSFRKSLRNTNTLA